MDADMQHPPELIKKLIDKWKEGYDVVYTLRRDTNDTGFVKK
jgi:dolichol-phosphate mannosyltransferase